jgi:hypothetical protein
LRSDHAFWDRHAFRVSVSPHQWCVHLMRIPWGVFTLQSRALCFSRTIRRDTCFILVFC